MLRRHFDGAAVIETLPIHFDVPEHAIPLATFVQTSQQTETAVRALTRDILGVEVSLEFVVLPPEEGTFKSRLGIIVIAAGGVLWGALESDIGKAFIRGLTGHEPAYYAESVGARLRLLGESATLAVASPPDVASCEEAVLAQMAKAFLSSDNHDLAKVGVTPSSSRDAFEAKNEFYAACSETLRLKGIGFTEDAEFPIQRDDFIRLQTPLPPKDEELLEEPWFFGVAELKVTSPNWDRGDRLRQWKGRDLVGRERYFRIEDDTFWKMASEGALHPHTIDVVKVQWAFQGSPSHPKHCRVLRVLEFNGEKISKALSGSELEAELGNLGADDEGEGPLFEWKK